MFHFFLYYRAHIKNVAFSFVAPTLEMVALDISPERQRATSFNSESACIVSGKRLEALTPYINEPRTANQLKKQEHVHLLCSPVLQQPDSLSSFSTELNIKANTCSSINLDSRAITPVQRVSQKVQDVHTLEVSYNDPQFSIIWFIFLFMFVLNLWKKYSYY